MNEEQRAGFEEWLQTHCDYDDLNKSEIELARDAWQAALQSPEVEALRKDSQRLSAIESDKGADIIRLSSDEWEVSGYAKDLYGTGQTLREAIDNAIKEAEMNTSKNQQEIDTSSERVDEIKLPPLPYPIAYAIAESNTGLWVKAILTVDADSAGVYLMDQKYVGRLITTEQAKVYATEAIKANLQTNQITGETSDGYHTFNELYAHRVRLFCLLMHAHKGSAWWSHKHHDNSEWEGWIIAGIDTPEGSATYHLPVSEIENLPKGIELPNGKEWDGHTSNDVLVRLLSLRQARGEPVYAFRRKGLTDFCTCTKEQFDELSDNPLFDIRIFYTAPQPAEPVKVRPETDSEHIARDIREGRFPEKSDRKMVPAAPVKVPVIEPNDLRIDTYRAEPHNAWIVKADTGVRVTHVPTGLSAECHKERSVHRNRALAMEKLQKMLQTHEPVGVQIEEIIESVKAYGRAYSMPNTTATELTIRLHDIRTLLAKYPAPQPQQQVSETYAPDTSFGPIKVGNLPTANQDDYPDLGDWWVQLRIGPDNDEVLARVYGDTPQQACERAVLLAKPQPQQIPEDYKLVPIEPTDEMLEAADQGDRIYTNRCFGKDMRTVMQGPYDHYKATLKTTPEPKEKL